jgi:threonine synthase
MKFISTRNSGISASFKEALFNGLAPDGGLYIPSVLPNCSLNIDQSSLLELGFNLLHPCIDDIAESDLHNILKHTFTFPIPLVALEKDIFLIELFHGPTLSFKDVGARFMAQCLGHFLKKENKSISILVATSGDTGSAIAHAFHHIPLVSVYILYPSKKISFLQEQQITTLGSNVHALEVNGTFDDCQRLVKQALANSDATTANSINIARLLPQMMYHAWGVAQLRQLGIVEAPTMIVPSGNLGNLTAAIYAKQLGVPIQHFIAASNANAVFPHYLETGEFMPCTSIHTLSNAMDVGNPSNFERIRHLQEKLTGISISDDETLAQIRSTYEKTNIIIDPHTAVGVAAAKQMQHRNHKMPLIVNATAHPAKFPDVIKRAIGVDIELPTQLQLALQREKQSQFIQADFDTFKQILRE